MSEDRTSPDRLVWLRQKLVDAFNEEELRTLCFDLRLDYDNLPGRSKPDKARELLQLLERSGGVNRLIRLAAMQRPEVAWEESVAASETEAPFKGLHFFDVGDAAIFFGREAKTAELVGFLRDNRFMAVIGASGSGKSSLLRAGLVPALTCARPLEGGVVPPAGSDRWQVEIITPGPRPLESLAASLTRTSESVTATTTLMDDLRKDGRSLHLYVRRTTGADGHLLLLVDQFEELFSLCKDPEERRAFVDNLLYAAEDDGVTTVVIALRADFYDRCAEYDNLRRALETKQKYIGAMNIHELRRAIEEPARGGGWEFEPKLVDTILRELGATEKRAPQPGALPLLSHVLLEVWKRRRGRLLTFTGYAEAGGVLGAIAKTAETVYQQLGPEKQPLARDIFLRLTVFGEGVQDIRRRLELDELSPDNPADVRVAAVLQALVEARLVTISANSVELAHEALIRSWQRLQDWIEEEGESLRFHRRLNEAAKLWRSEGDEAGLYSGTRLLEAQRYAERPLHALTDDERAFLDASIKREVIRERARYMGQAAGLALGTSLGYGLMLGLYFVVAQLDGSASSRLGPELLVTSTLFLLLSVLPCGALVGLALGFALWWCRQAPRMRLGATIATGALVGVAAFLVYIIATSGWSGLQWSDVVAGALIGAGLGLGAGLSVRLRPLVVIPICAMSGLAAATIVRPDTLHWSLLLNAAGGFLLGTCAAFGLEATAVDVSGAQRQERVA